MFSVGGISFTVNKEAPLGSWAQSRPQKSEIQQRSLFLSQGPVQTILGVLWVSVAP